MSSTEELERLMDFEFWEEVLVIFAGYLLPVVVKTVLEGRGIVELPDEVYGVISIIGAGYGLEGSYKHSAIMGGGVYVADTAVNGRMNVQDRLTEMAA
ncbi:structural protein VP6 [Saline Natrinema sp. J7-1 virus 1]|uniref:Structural protein VP6 n=1 Tax=Saline Natrinema sp. J7-1 virus 1 TaxID=2847285 RepID=A0AAE9VLA4_9VIRU|nr:structural protein VP6 [Saline Natrinema sp. J7-1 virus 1]WBE14029.1 structural protein VP6 [Saline Natrinema sp. J7-1 virus 1]